MEMKPEEKQKKERKKRNDNFEEGFSLLSTPLPKRFGILTMIGALNDS